MKSLKIHTVNTEDDRRSFVSFPWQVYMDDAYWVPPLFNERMDFIQNHPFLEHAKVSFFLAKSDKEIVGTIAAFTNYRHNEFHDENIAFLGFFEVIDDREVADALLETAENWARNQGHDAIRGPGQYFTNGECGLLVDGFDDSPRILMTYNPRRYVDYFENRGYQKAMDLHAYALDTDIYAGGSRFPKKLIRVVEKIKAKGEIKIRKVDMKNYDLEVERAKTIYNQSWAHNWGFVPMTDAEFISLGEELRQILDPDLTLVGEIDGKPIGVSITVPDMNQPLLRAYPKPGTPELWTLSKLVWNWKRKPIVEWIIPPKHQLEIFGFLLILTGFLLQLIFYLD